MYRKGKWAQAIIALQEEDGKWGCFHSLSRSYGASMTTEQALRRLQRLGFTMEDECIRRAVSYLSDCLAGEKEIPDYREKFHDWDVFTRLMLSVWIRRFTPSNADANRTAENWAAVVSAGFEDCGDVSRENHGLHGIYRRAGFNQKRYEEAYRDILKPTHGTLLGFGNFYHVSLLTGCLPDGIEEAFFDNILAGGIYYIYEHPLTVLPDEFESRGASRYLAALECLAGYRCASEKLAFAVEWIYENRGEDGLWDLGKTAADRVYLPLSDSWRKAETRRADCTCRVTDLLDRIGKQNIQNT